MARTIGAALAAYHVVLMALIETHSDKAALRGAIERYGSNLTDLTLDSEVPDDQLEAVKELIIHRRRNFTTWQVGVETVLHSKPEWHGPVKYINTELLLCHQGLIQ